MKIRAFTLIEALITLVLSGVIISVCGAILMQYTGLFEMYKNKQDDSANRMECYWIICLDFERSVLVSGDESELKFEQKDGKTVVYAFYEDKILRNTEVQSDTFLLKSEIKELGFIDEYKKYLNKCVLILKEENQQVWSFYKPYSNAVLFNNDQQI